jgi:hypothetical protein
MPGATRSNEHFWADTLHTTANKSLPELLRQATTALRSRHRVKSPQSRRPPHLISEKMQPARKFGPAAVNPAGALGGRAGCMKSSNDFDKTSRLILNRLEQDCSQRSERIVIAMDCPQAEHHLTRSGFSRTTARRFSEKFRPNPRLASQDTADMQASRPSSTAVHFRPPYPSAIGEAHVKV